MALSAQEVHDKQFKLVRQATGYDIDEVDAFLDEVEAEILRLTEALARAKSLSPGAHASEGSAPEPIRGSGVLENGAGAAQPAGRAVDILELAQKTADEYLAQALRTADSLVSEAQERARGAVAALEGQRADLEGRIESLRSMEAEVRARLTGYFESQLNDLRSAVG